MSIRARQLSLIRVERLSRFKHASLLCQKFYILVPRPEDLPQTRNKDRNPTHCHLNKPSDQRINGSADRRMNGSDPVGRIFKF